MNQNIQERRIMGQLCTYWKKIQGDNFLPKKSDIDSEEIAHILPYCVVLDIDNKGNIDISFIGEKVMKFHEEKIFDGTFIQFVSPNKETFQEYIEDLLENKEPITDSGEVMNQNQEEVRYRQCILPLSDDGKKITALICAINCKVQ